MNNLLEREPRRPVIMKARQFIDHIQAGGFVVEVEKDDDDHLMMTAARDINGVPVWVHMRIPSNPLGCHRRTLNRFNELIWSTIAAQFGVGNA